MIDRLIDWSAHHPLAVLLLTASAVGLGVWSASGIPLDALPDLSETQVIVHTTWDRSPDVVENQVTYPIVTSLLGAPKVKDVRGISDFGASYVYVIFEEGTDLYWARSRVTEYLAKARSRLPAEVHPELGPDAGGLGWVFQYALVDTSGSRNLADLRSLQDWYLRYHLEAVKGVAEVASLGGFVRQYQVTVNPSRLQALNIPIDKVIAAIRASNNDVGGRVVEMSGREYMVRGRGYLKTTTDLENVALGMNRDGVPIRLSDLATVALGPDLRRGAADLNGDGETVCGIVVMRQGENALQVIDRVKARLKEIQAGLPPGVKLVTVYDRSELITGTIANLRATLIEELIVVALVVLIFLWHFPSAVIPILTIPIAVCITAAPLRWSGMTVNAMSLGGLAIAVGAMVDAAIVVVEQTHRRLAEWRVTGEGDPRAIALQAIREVAGPGFFSLIVIAVAFLPVFALEAQEGRLFRPLALTKSFSMIAAAIMAVTLDPALRLLLLRVREFQFHPRWLARLVNTLAVGHFHSEENHPLSRVLIRLYTPVVQWSLQWGWAILAVAIMAIALTIPAYQRLGSEFMPPLDEGTLLFMPTTVPGISLPEARRLMQAQDRVLASFPQVERVTGKAGRAETATDPAPISMLETVILLKPKDQWPKIPTWYDGLPGFLKPLFRPFTPDHISTDDLIASMDRALKTPGVSNVWTMPIRARTEMQTTGIRTAVGVKVTGPDPATIEQLGAQVEKVLRELPATRDAFAERTGSGYFLDIDFRHDRLGLYGLTVDEAQAAVANAIGGENITTILDGRERYPVNVRYPSDARSSLEAMERLVTHTASGQQIPLAQIADLKLSQGPAMLRDENGLLTGYVYADVSGGDVGGYVETARKLVNLRVVLPPGYALLWSGQYEAILRVGQRLKLLVPVTALLIGLLLYWNTRSLTKTAMVLLAVPLSAIGAIWLMAMAGYHMSTAAWVGLIALLGVDAETGVFMLLYLDLSFEQRKRAGLLHSRDDLKQAVLAGAAHRIRPKMMTVAAMFMGLVPIMLSTGAGADTMKRIAAPMIGGIVTSFLGELIVFPVLYEFWKWHGELKRN